MSELDVVKQRTTVGLTEYWSIGISQRTAISNKALCAIELAKALICKQQNAPHIIDVTGLAAAMADDLFELFAKKGWSTPIPPLAELHSLPETPRSENP